MKFTRTYKVRSSEINPQYLLKEHFIGMYFQECFAEYAASVELAAYDLSKRGLTWLTSASCVEFLSDMPFWRDEVEVAAWVCKASSARLFVGFCALSGGREIAGGCATHLIADIDTHKPQPLGEIAARFGPPCGDTAAISGLGKIEPFDNGCCADIGVSQTTQFVRFDDLDFNMHLNNVKYIPRALESVPFEYRLGHKLAKYRIRYEREARMGDEITSRCTRRGNCFTHLLIRESDGAELGVMESVWK